jgi:hypothetical protein
MQYEETAAMWKVYVDAQARGYPPCHDSIKPEGLPIPGDDKDSGCDGYDFRLINKSNKF